MEELYERQCRSKWELFCIQSDCRLVASEDRRVKEWRARFVERYFSSCPCGCGATGCLMHLPRLLQRVLISISALSCALRNQVGSEGIKVPKDYPCTVWSQSQPTTGLLPNTGKPRLLLYLTWFNYKTTIASLFCVCVCVCWFYFRCPSWACV